MPVKTIKLYIQASLYGSALQLPTGNCPCGLCAPGAHKNIWGLSKQKSINLSKLYCRPDCVMCRSMLVYWVADYSMGPAAAPSQHCMDWWPCNVMYQASQLDYQDGASHHHSPQPGVIPWAGSPRHRTSLTIASSSGHLYILAPYALVDLVSS